MSHDIPLPQSALSLIETAKTLLPTHFDATPGAFIAPHGYVVDAAGALTILALDMPTDDARRMLRDHLPETKAIAFVHVVEAWSAAAEDPAEVELILLLKAQGRLQEAPAHLLRSVVNLFVETPEVPVMAWELAVTIAADGTRSLSSEWIPKILRYPRPTFRRYFPEDRPLPS